MTCSSRERPYSSLFIGDAGAGPWLATLLRADRCMSIRCAQSSQRSSDAIPALTAGQYSTVYNLLSLVIASMLFTAIFLLLSQRRWQPRYRNALLISAMVCGIAAYHYFRIFANFQESYPAGAQHRVGRTCCPTSSSTRATATSTGS